MAVTDLTLELLREYLHYNPDTGIFTWLKNRRRGVKAGDVAGSLMVDGYWVICLFDRRYKAHRLAFLDQTGNLPVHMVDHINGNKSDNRFSNLRQATNAQNKRNVSKRKDNTSGFKGVVVNKYGKYIAQCASGGRMAYLGSFGTAEAASLRYKEYTKQLHGEFYHD